VRRLRRGRPASRTGSTRPRLQDSAARRRTRAVIGSLLVLAGLAGVVLAVVAAGVAAPADVRLDPDGETEVPRTYAFQHHWVLFGVVDDPRRVPPLAEIGCEPAGDLDTRPQPDDMTTYGSRVIDETSVAAIAVLGHSGEDAAMVCDGSGPYEPLWLLPASEAPPFTPTAIGILGLLVLVGGLLVHPAVVELPDRWRRRPAD
jgi:hypothetical protein